MTNVLDDGAIERVLVVMAHPDDADFGAAGTIARWTGRGLDVTYLIVTDGDAGGFDPAVPRADIPGIRRAEQQAAAKCVGVADVRFLGYSDGSVEATFDLRRDIARVIRQIRPHRVVAMSPERSYEIVYPSHPDHRAVGSATLDAVYPDARNPYAFPELVRDEGLEEWTVSEVWITGHPTANHHTDVTDELDRKLAALAAHASQTEHMDVEGLLRAWMGGNALAAGLPEGRLAESFHVMSTG